MPGPVRMHPTAAHVPAPGDHPAAHRPLGPAAPTLTLDGRPVRVAAMRAAWRTRQIGRAHV